MPGSRFSYPRLAQAKDLLPRLRQQLAAAASRRPLEAPVDLLPIAEDGLLGYELVPHLETRTYLIIGSDAHGKPALRKHSYGGVPPKGLRSAGLPCASQPMIR